MVSMSRTLPARVSHLVSNTSESPRYWRRVAGPPSAGASCQVPGLLAAEQSGKTGRRVEPRQAQPVDGTPARHERGGLQVTEQGVVFEAVHRSARFVAGDDDLDAGMFAPANESAEAGRTVNACMPTPVPAARRTRRPPFGTPSALCVLTRSVFARRLPQRDRRLFDPV